MTVPKLRFPEFDGEWIATTLARESVCLDNKRVPLEQSDRAKRSGPYPYYGASGVIDYIDEYLFDETLVLLGEDGANIINRSSPLAFLAKGKYWVNNHAHVYRANGSPEFLATYLENLRYEKYNTGTAQPKLNGEVCKKLKLTFPTLPEQKKIAGFLGVVDAKIAALRARRDGLERYKRGLMQALFSQTLRFTKPNGTAFPDWEEKRLGEVLEAAKKVPVVDYYARETLTVQLHAKGLRKSGQKPNKTGNPRPYYKRFAGELIIGRQNFHNGGVALVDTTHDGLIASNAISSFVFKSNETNPQYVIRLLARYDFYGRVGDLIGGTGQKEISVTEFLKLRVPYPHPDEQQKLADALSAMDAKISAVTGQVAQMEAFKKGLLQQMFV